MKVLAKRDAKIWLANATSLQIKKDDELNVVGTYLDDDEVVYVIHYQPQTAPFAVRSSLIT